MGMMDQDILKVLYTEKQIAARIESMGMEMYEDLKDKEPLFVSVLRGGVHLHGGHRAGLSGAL